jgi:hypothetical protein
MMNNIKTGPRKSIIFFLLMCLPLVSNAQNFTINMAAIDGITITPDNILNYQVQSSARCSVAVKGVIRYRNSGLNLSYTFNTTLSPGLNTFNMDVVRPGWNFSSSALRELFMRYKLLPAGTFEYCVSIVPANVPGESATTSFDECLYHRADDFFVINLVDPSDKAKIAEYNPMLTWLANYSLSNELTYRIRIAEMKQGQNAVNAVMRNQPIYEEDNLMQSSIIYPVGARPLVANQWYAWTVDAYYKGIMLGGSETWQFIIPDTISKVVTGNRSYIDIKKESGLYQLTALGNLKLKYVLDDSKTDSLYLEIVSEKGKKYPLTPDKLKAVYGDNRYVLDLAGTSHLRHNGIYTLKITSKTGHVYNLLFEYKNPDYQN